MNILDALNWRYAVKKFSDKKVTNENLKELLEATRLSASGYGLQPYKIIVIESVELRGKLLPYSFGQDKVAESSHLIIFAAHTDIGDCTVDRYIKKHAQVIGKSIEQLNNFSTHMKSAFSHKSQEQKQEWAHNQAYIALGNFLTCAASMKIDSCPMTGFDKPGFDKVLGLHEKGLTSSIICPIGYRHPSDEQARSPKVRLDFDDIIMEL